jgi:hypothetical protein
MLQVPSSAQFPPMPVKGIAFESEQQLTRSSATASRFNLRHSRRRKKSRPSQRKIDAGSRQFRQGIGILHRP